MPTRDSRCVRDLLPFHVLHCKFITLDGSGGLDFYDVSLVDGYNLPMQVVPQGAPASTSRNCTTTGCLMDLNKVCPSERKVTTVGGQRVACRAPTRCSVTLSTTVAVSMGIPTPISRPPTRPSSRAPACGRTTKPTTTAPAPSPAPAAPTTTSPSAPPRQRSPVPPPNLTLQQLIGGLPLFDRSKSVDENPQVVSVPQAVQLGGGGINSAMIYQGALVASGNRTLQLAKAGARDGSAAAGDSNVATDDVDTILASAGPPRCSLLSSCSPALFPLRHVACAQCSDDALAVDDTLAAEVFDLSLAVLWCLLPLRSVAYGLLLLPSSSIYGLLLLPSTAIYCLRSGAASFIFELSPTHSMGTRNGNKGRVANWSYEADCALLDILVEHKVNDDGFVNGNLTKEA
ncbi:hypothetical protein Taro_020476 [Colocasia esculenta]|uniref:Uncharacterized protein n=1 Tax=Colocasia esculenta TaxID=4460 RepID=A0A843V8K3_COLES|nr:hypothetical protein [Colocasia esculenta]